MVDCIDAFFAGSRIATGDGAVFRGDIPNINDELGELTRAFNVAAGELELRVEELSRASMAGEEVEGELRAAHKIQASLLPSHFPDDNRFQLFGVNSPADMSVEIFSTTSLLKMTTLLS